MMAAAQAAPGDEIDPDRPFLDLVGITTSASGRSAWLSLRSFSGMLQAPGHDGQYGITGPRPAGLIIACGAPADADAQALARGRAKVTLRVPDHPQAPETLPFWSPMTWLRELTGFETERYPATVTLPTGRQVAVVERRRTSYAGGKGRLAVIFPPGDLLDWLAEAEGETPTPFTVLVEGDGLRMQLHFGRHDIQAAGAARMAAWCPGGSARKVNEG